LLIAATSSWCLGSLLGPWVWDAPLVLFSAFQSPNAYFLRWARRVIGS
jgi:hypothetical protein